MISKWLHSNMFKELFTFMDEIPEKYPVEQMRGLNKSR